MVRIQLQSMQHDTIKASNYSLCLCVFVDVTRVLLLDESHAQSVSTSVTVLLRDISQAHAAKTFPVSPHYNHSLPLTSHITSMYTL